MKIIAFFCNKGGVGTTSLVYHLHWMFRDLGLKVLSVDLDPQAELTSKFLDEDRLESLWRDENSPMGIMKAIRPIMTGADDIGIPSVEVLDENTGIMTGDLGLSHYEDTLSEAWSGCLDGDESFFRILSSMYRSIVSGARSFNADITLIDIGPNLGAINRTVLLSAGHIVAPLAADLYSLQCLRTTGLALRRWRNEWGKRRKKNAMATLCIPEGEMEPAGYVVLQHAARRVRQVREYTRWNQGIPTEYRVSVMNEKPVSFEKITDDPYCFAVLKNYQNLLSLSVEARKPMFSLLPADGAMGTQTAAVHDCYADFNSLARAIAARAGIPL